MNFEISDGGSLWSGQFKFYQEANFIEKSSNKKFLRADPITASQLKCVVCIKFKYTISKFCLRSLHLGKIWKEVTIQVYYLYIQGHIKRWEKRKHFTFGNEQKFKLIWNDFSSFSVSSSKLIFLRLNFNQLRNIIDIEMSIKHKKQHNF